MLPQSFKENLMSIIIYDFTYSGSIFLLEDPVRSAQMRGKEHRRKKG